MKNTHRQIAQSALRLFLHGGIHAVTGEAVAKAASVSRMTVYRHFLSKRDLVRAALGGVAEVFRQALDNQVGDGFVPPMSRLGEAIDRLPAGDLPTRLAEVRERYPELHEEFLAEQRRGLDDLLQRFFADARAAGHLRKDFDRHIVETIVREATAGVLANPLLWQKGLSPAELFGAVEETLLYGLLQRKGRGRRDEVQ